VRLLVLSTAREFHMSARVLMTIGAGLAARRHHVDIVCCQGSASEREISRRFPKVPLHPVADRHVLAQSFALRRIVRDLRIETILVGTERDQLTAALAIGRHGGVVRPLAIGERFAQGWRARLASSRATSLVIGDDVGINVHTDTHVRAAIAWPRTLLQDSSDTPLRLAPAVPPLLLAVVAGASTEPAEHAAGAAALRAAARLLTRSPGLRVLLLGERSALQAMRLHAASVGLADRVDVMTLDSLIEQGPFNAAAVWVTAGGDTGAVSIVSAMMRRIPVVVPRGFDTEALVASRITGFVADDTDPAGSVAALARLFADADAHCAMGAIAASRAERLHSWDALIERTAEALARAGGRRSTSRAVA